jgi:hypothetical protein
MALGQYEVYASLYARGQVNAYASGRTLAPSPALSQPASLRRASRDRYGQHLDQIEADFAALAGAHVSAAPTGRRPRRQP